MKKVLILTLAAMVLSVPAGAWDVDWSTGFEQPTYAPGPLVPQDGWASLSGTSPNVQNTGPIHTGEQAVTQATGVSLAGKNLTGLSYGFPYYQGYAKFWVYDPGDVGDPPVQTDGRVGIQSSVGGASVSTMFTAGVQTSRSPDYWVFQWSWSPVVGDGVAAPGGVGYAFVAGPPAPRVWNAWSYVYINWAFTYNVPNDPSSGGAGVIQWRVNQSGIVPNLTLNFNDLTARWGSSHEIAGVVLGSVYSCVTPTSFDDFEFHGDAVPEPSSLLALGTGLMGLAGVIRRRR